MSSSHVFTNLESTNPEFVSRNLPYFLDLLKMDFCFRIRIDKSQNRQKCLNQKKCWKKINKKQTIKNLPTYVFRIPMLRILNSQIPNKQTSLSSKCHHFSLDKLNFFHSIICNLLHCLKYNPNKPWTKYFVKIRIHRI